MYWFFEGTESVGVGCVTYLGRFRGCKSECWNRKCRFSVLHSFRGRCRVRDLGVDPNTTYVCHPSNNVGSPPYWPPSAC